MKSMSRGCGDPAAVTSTMLSPQRMTTEPLACLAHFPVSMVISLPPTTAVSRTNGIRVLCWSRRRPRYRGLVPLSNLSNSTRRQRLSDSRDSTERSNQRDPLFDDVKVTVLLVRGRYGTLANKRKDPVAIMACQRSGRPDRFHGSLV